MSASDELLSAIANLGNGSAAATGSSGRVYVGSSQGQSKLSQVAEKKPSTSAPKKGEPGYGVLAPGKSAADTRKGQDVYKTTDQMYGQWYQWSTEQQRQFAQKLVAQGLMTEGDAADMDQVRKVWMSMVDEAASYAAAGKKLTVDDVVNSYAAFAGSKALASSSSSHPDGVETTTSKQFNITDPTSAKDAVNQIFQANLGRDAAPGEIDAFTKALNTAERANPTSTQTDTTYSGGEAVGSTQTTTGGVDRTQVLQDQARSTPEYGAYQAATTYANALFSALKSPI